MRLVTVLLIGAVEMFLLAAGPKPNVLVDWIVADNVVSPNIISLTHVSVHIVQRDVIAMERRWCRWHRAGRGWICRTCSEARKTDETNED